MRQNRREGVLGMNREAILQTLQHRVPNLLAAYAFGSRIQGSARADSDLDLAVLVSSHRCSHIRQRLLQKFH